MARNSDKAQGLKSVSTGLTSARNCKPCKGKKLTSKAILMGEQHLLSDFPVPQIVDRQNLINKSAVIFVVVVLFICLFVFCLFVCLLLLWGRGGGQGAGEGVKERKKSGV